MLQSKELFAAFVMDKSNNNFYVYLVNNSGVNFKAVKMFTGAFASDDDNLIETTRAVKEKGPLKANSVLKIDQTDWYELDFVIWYNLDLKEENGNLHQYWFQLPKYAWGYDEKVIMIPLLNQEGMVIALNPRS